MFHVWLNGPQDFRAVESAGLLGKCRAHEEVGGPGSEWASAEEYLYPCRLTFDDAGKAIWFGGTDEERVLEDVIEEGS